MKLQAVILTGTRDVHNPLIAGTGLHSKVLLPVGGKPMVLSVMEAIAGSRYQPEIYVSSSDPDVLRLKTDLPFKTLPSEAKAVSSILKSLERLPREEWVLFVSGDHPLLTAEMIDHFIEEALARQLTFAAAVVERSLVERDYPESKRTYFKAKAGAYSGGNLFLIDKSRFRGSAAFMETIDRNRKKPWKNVLMLNPFTMMRILLRQMDIHEIARVASGLFRCEAGMVVMPFAECCMDVDKPSDQVIAETILRGRREPEPLFPFAAEPPKASLG